MNQRAGQLESSELMTVIWGGDLIAADEIISDGELVVREGKIEAVGPWGTAARFLAEKVSRSPDRLIVYTLNGPGTRIDPAYLEKRLRMCGPVPMIDLDSGLVADPGGGLGSDRSLPFPLVVLDARGYLVAPGFIDLHIHGAGGGDFTVDSLEGWIKAARMLARSGTTAFLATTLASDAETLETALGTATKLQGVFHNWKLTGDGCGGIPAPDTLSPGACPLGVHLEGPYINPDYAGGQPMDQIRPANACELEGLLEAGAKLASQQRSGAGFGRNLVAMVTLAPDIPGADGLLRVLGDYGIVASAGHTGATYDQFKAAVAKGIAHAAHLFNAMLGFHHREPGTVGAAIDSPEVTLEVIADGHHVHPAAIRLLAGALLGERQSARYKGHGEDGLDRLLLVTDAMSACGLPEGNYSLGGQQVVVKNGTVRLASPAASLAGSILTLNQAIRNMINWTGISLPQAINLASLNPARRLGIDAAKGSLEPGKDADIVIMNRDFEVSLTMINGLIGYTGNCFAACSRS